MPNQPTTKPASSPLLVTLSTLILVFGVIGLVSGNRQQAFEEPRPIVLSSHTGTSQQQCAECHSDITDSIHLAPHSRTLQRADNRELIQRFAGREFQHPHSKALFRYYEEDGKLMVNSKAYGRELQIDWLFGSGTHAQTPLIIWENDDGTTSGVEHSVSWYPDGQLAETLGSDENEDQLGLFAMGASRSPAETVNCFGCHSTSIPNTDSRIHFDQIEGGIGCVRCHWNTQDHVRAMNAGGEPSIESFSKMTPIEAVDRCGECHRRADEMDGVISPKDESIVRFASVGLVQSPCFQKQHEVTLDNGQPARFDCTSCHDPHRPTSHDWRVHVDVCISCHDEAHEKAVDCTQATREENCLKCHMPQIPANENLKFTDHWIRVRNE